jgi:HEAT repeat protein
VPELVQYLRGGDSEKRRLAASALKGLGPEAREAVSALIEALTSPDEWVRLYAAQTLGRIGPKAAAAVPELLARARDQSLSRREQNGHRTVDSMLRDAAIRDLGQIGAEPDAVVPALVQALADADEFVCTEAALALGRLRAHPEAVVPALESLLLSDHDQARKAAAFALGEYGPKARSAVPILIGMTEESEDARLASTPAIEPFFVESAWSRESYRNDFPLAPLHRHSEASFATEALQKIDPDALRSAGIESASP